MARTTQVEVNKVFEIDTSVIVDITPFLTGANRLVTKFCSTDDYSETELTEIETWLAAHFCSVKQKIANSEKVDVLSEKFEGQTGMGLQSSLYGQTAMALDWAGGLASWDAIARKGIRKVTGGLTYVGKTKTVWDADPEAGT